MLAVLTCSVSEVQLVADPSRVLTPRDEVRAPQAVVSLEELKTVLSDAAPGEFSEEELLAGLLRKVEQIKPRRSTWRRSKHICWR